VGVYVCSGGFTPDALRDTKRAPFMLLKYDITGLVDLMLEFKVGVEDYRLDCPRIDDRFWDEIG
jgi:restriction endonuclease Mrr